MNTKEILNTEHSMRLPGFEPGTPALSEQCATGLRHSLIIFVQDFKKSILLLFKSYNWNRFTPFKVLF